MNDHWQSKKSLTWSQNIVYTDIWYGKWRREFEFYLTCPWCIRTLSASLLSPWSHSYSIRILRVGKKRNSRMSLKNLYSSNRHQLRECQVKITAIKVALTCSHCVRACISCHVIGEFKQRSFWATRVNRKWTFCNLGQWFSKKKKFPTDCIYQSKGT